MLNFFVVLPRDFIVRIQIIDLKREKSHNRSNGTPCISSFHLILLLLNIDIYRLDMVAWETTDTCKISNYHLFKINTRRYFQRFHVGLSSHLSANINHMKSHHCLETEACHSRWFRWYFLTSTSLDIHQNGAEGSILKIDTVGWEGFYQSSMYCIIRILVNMIWLEVEEGSVSGSLSSYLECESVFTSELWTLHTKCQQMMSALLLLGQHTHLSFSLSNSNQSSRRNR